MTFLTFFALQRQFSIRDEGNFTSVNCIKTYRKNCCFSKSYLEIQIFFQKKEEKSDFFIKRSYLKLLPRKERSDNYSWRDLNPRPLDDHQFSSPELQESVFLSLGKGLVRRCIQSIYRQKGSLKDQSWQVSSYPSIVESHSSLLGVHEQASSKFSDQSFDIPLEPVAWQCSVCTSQLL